MAENKIRIKIDAETKQAQKELARLEKEYQKQEKVVQKLSDTYQKNASQRKQPVTQAKQQLEAERKEYQRLLETIKQTKTEIDALESRKNFNKAYMFSAQYKDNKGLVSANLKKWGFSPSDIEKDKALNEKQGQDIARAYDLKQRIAEAAKLFEKLQQDEKRANDSDYANLEIEDKKLQDIGQEVQAQQESVNALEAQNAELAQMEATSAKLQSAWGIILTILKVIAKVAVAIGKAFLKLSVTVLKVAGVIGKGLVKSITGAFKLIGKLIDAVTTPIKNIAKRLKSAIMMGFTRLIRQAVMKAMQEIGALIATNAELMASLNSLKGTFIGAFQPILNAVAPVLIKIINWIQTLIGYISALMSLFFGLGKASSKSAKGLYEQAEAAKASGGGADSMFASWDTVQQLSSGGGGSAGANAPTFDFEFPEIPNKWKDILKGIDWTEIGRDLGKKLNEITKKINQWLKTKFAPEMKNWGHRLATLLNGVFEESIKAFNTGDMETQQGAVIANFLNGIFGGLLEFAKTLHWSDVGTYIKNQIMAFFSEADTKMWGQAIDAWIHGILDAIIMAVSNWDIQLVTQKIIDFFNGIDFMGIASLLGAALSQTLQLAVDFMWTLLNNVSNLPPESQPAVVMSNFLNEIISSARDWVIKNTDKIGDIGHDIIDQLWTFFDTLDWEGLAQLISAIGTGIIKVITKAIKTLPEHKDEIIKNIQDFFNNLTFDPEALSEFAGALVDALLAALEIAWELIKGGFSFAENLVTSIFTGLNPFSQEASDNVSAFVEDSVSVTESMTTSATKTGEQIGENLVTGIETGAKQKKSLVDDAVKEAAKIDDATQKQVEDKSKEIGRNIPKGMVHGIQEKESEIQDAVKTMSESAIETCETVNEVNSPSRVYHRIGAFCMEGFKEGLVELIPTFKTWFNTNIHKPMMNGIQEILEMEGDSGSSKAYEKIGKAIVGGIIDGMNSLNTQLVGACNNILGILSSTMSQAISMINQMSTAFNAAGSAMGSTTFIPQFSTNVSYTAVGANVEGFATGTVVNPSHPFMAILGDNKHEQEVVSPISTMKQALMEALQDSGLNRGGDVILEIDGTKFARITNPYMLRENKRIGLRATGGAI